MTREQIRNILLFAVGLAGAVLLLTRPTLGQAWLRYATYFVMFGVVGTWLVRWSDWARARWSSPREVLRANLPEILLAAGAVALVFATHDWAFKVLSDESNMVGVGRSLSQDWRFDFPGTSRFYFGAHHYSRYGFEKRPPLFMFVLSLVNSLTGYRVRNIWYLNASLTGLTMVVVAGALRRRVGRPWNLLAVVWGIANPIVLETASAGGVEPILALLWAITGILMLEVLEDASSPSVPLFIATLYLVALARIEAGPMAVMMVVAILVFSKDRALLLARGRDDWLVWAAPIVAISPVVQRLQKDYFQGSKLKPFGFNYVVDNVHNWQRALGTSGNAYPFNAFVTVTQILAVVALVAFVISGRSKLSRAERVACLVFAALTTSFVVMYSAYYWGQPTKATSARFYALPFFFAGLAVPLLLRCIAALRARPVAVAVFVGAVFVQAVPTAYDRTFVNTLPWRKHHIVMMEYLAPRLPDHTILLVTHLPGQFLIYGMGALPYATFRKERRELASEINRGFYDEVLFAQDINTTTGAVAKGMKIDADLKTEVVFERPYNGTTALRISRLVREPGKQAISPTRPAAEVVDDQDVPSTEGPETEP